MEKARKPPLQNQLRFNGDRREECKETIESVERDADIEVDLSSDTEDDRALWEEHAVIYRVVGPNMSRNHLREWIAKQWGVGFVVKFLPRGFFVVVFAEGPERNRVLHQENWFVGDNPLYIQPWHSNFDPLPLVVYDSSVWIRLYNLPIEYWGDGSLEKIGQMLGTLLEIDEKIIEEDLYTYARLKIVAVKIIPSHIILITSEGKWRWHMEIEKDIIPCRRCGRKFHPSAQCKMFVRRARSRPFRRPKQSWVAKAKPYSQNLLCLPHKEQFSGSEDHPHVSVSKLDQQIATNNASSSSVLPLQAMIETKENKPREAEAISPDSENEFELF
ncbi:hypothetical protein SUGI_1066960 [Cryptomeria japonica]|nr:hypothetical protein SUGI_1066960 [Cryptomeria japonica]